MIFPSNLVWFNGIAKLWTFKVEGSKWQNRQYHTLTGHQTNSTVVSCRCFTDTGTRPTTMNPSYANGIRGVLGHPPRQEFDSGGIFRSAVAA